MTRLRRRGLLLACAAMLVAPLGVSQPASAAALGYTRTTALVPVLDGPAGDHTSTMDTALYMPDAATSAAPAPAILMTHGFGLTKDSPEVTNYADFFARQGYVVLTYTATGFGKSSGCVQLDSKDWDAKDASGLISAVLAPNDKVRHDATGPVVGMVGGSYGGGVTLNVAEADARVRAIAPGRTWNSLQYALDPNNYARPGADRFDHLGAAQGVFKAGWTSLFFALGNTQPAMGNGGCVQDKLASADPATIAGTPCLGYYLAVCAVNARLISTGDFNAEDKKLIARASGALGIDKLTVPTLLVQGQSDTLFNLNDAYATYRALAKQGTPVQMIWNSGGHGGYSSQPGEGETYDGGTHTPDAEYLPLRTLAFFDHYLRGTGTPGPAFSYYADWLPYSGSGPNDEQYLDAPAFPLPHQSVLTLSADGTLALPAKPVEPATMSFLNPPGGAPAAYTETSNFTGPDSSPSVAGLPPTEQPGQHLDFTSSEFSEAVDAVGIPTARLNLTHANGGDLIFFGKVYDVAPDGSATLIHRLIAPVRVPAADVGRSPVQMNLLGFAHRFEAGHRVRLTLASTDATARNATVADQISLTTGGTDPSTFTFPALVGVSTTTPPSESLSAPSPSTPSAGAPQAGGALPTTGIGAALPLLGLVLVGSALTARARSRRRSATM